MALAASLATSVAPDALDRVSSNASGRGHGEANRGSGEAAEAAEAAEARGGGGCNRFSRRLAETGVERRDSRVVRSACGKEQALPRAGRGPTPAVAIDIEQTSRWSHGAGGMDKSRAEMGAVSSVRRYRHRGANRCRLFETT